MKTRPISLAILPALMLAACGDETAPDPAGAATSSDPLLASALNDPLMVDPDLAYRNEANAAITIRHDHAMPLFGGSDEAAQRAREEARLQLLENGSVLDLPDPVDGEGVGSLAGETTASAMINAIGGPAACTQSLSEGFAWAARLPEAARVMPHGMVQQAGGGDANGCSVRVVRYLTPATIEDALEYHFNRAHRAQLRVERFSKPEQIVRASRGSTQFIVHARPAPNAMSAVDLIYWQR